MLQPDRFVHNSTAVELVGYPMNQLLLLGPLLFPPMMAYPWQDGHQDTPLPGPYRPCGAMKVAVFPVILLMFSVKVPVALDELFPPALKSVAPPSTRKISGTSGPWA